MGFGWIEFNFNWMGVMMGSILTVIFLLGNFTVNPLLRKIQ